MTGYPLFWLIGFVQVFDHHHYHIHQLLSGLMLMYMWYY